MEPLAGLDAEHRAVRELQTTEVADGGGHPKRIRVTADHAEDVVEHPLLDHLLDLVQRDVAAVPREGRDAEHRHPPEGREAWGAPRPEGPARERAQARVELERAPVGGAGRQDAEREVEVGEIDRPGPRLGRAGRLAPERPEEGREGDLAGRAVELARDERKEQERHPLEQERHGARAVDGARGAGGREEIDAADDDQHGAEIGETVEVGRRQLESPRQGARGLDQDRQRQREEQEAGLPAPEEERGAEQHRGRRHKQASPSAIRPTSRPCTSPGRRSSVARSPTTNTRVGVPSASR